LFNLVANAIRYSPERGRIRVCVYRTPDGAGVIEVHDNGPGIAARHQDLVFERFYRVDPGRSKEAGGTGLGLAIARTAVALNGGRIELESEENRGSVFRIVLPVCS
jgi:two-component system phosphate regulon sensor histidine kinase PhoR